MNKELIFQLLADRYSKTGKHISQVYDDPIFKKLSLDDQQRFIQQYAPLFKKSVVFTLTQPTGLSLAASAAASGASIYNGYTNFISHMYPTGEARVALAKTLAEKSGMPLQQQLGRFLRHPKPDEFAFIPEIFKSHIVDYLKSPQFRKQMAVGVGITAGLYLLTHILKATQLKARANAVLHASSPEGALVESHNARPFMEQTNPLLHSATNIVRTFIPH